MVIGKPCQYLLIGLLVVLAPVQAVAVAVSPPLPVLASPAAVPRETVQPVSKAAAGSTPALAQPSAFVVDVPAVAPSRRMGPPVFAGLSIIEITLIGGALIAMVMFARRRHRRRIGWGVIPDRSQRWLRRAG